jgi:hypothetical protein
MTWFNRVADEPVTREIRRAVDDGDLAHADRLSGYLVMVQQEREGIVTEIVERLSRATQIAVTVSLLAILALLIVLITVSLL